MDIKGTLQKGGRIIRVRQGGPSIHTSENDFEKNRCRPLLWLLASPVLVEDTNEP